MGEERKEMVVVCETGGEMRNYKLTYFLASCLVIGAFIAQYVEMGKSKAFRNDTMPWVLFCGGMILMLIGTREYRSNQKEANKK